MHSECNFTPVLFYRKLVQTMEQKYMYSLRIIAFDIVGVGLCV